ncbi:hypothetical protein NX059_007624 [Plenodomus lindquistii]|nr:hypothetical protein NX059_007624 [Plenodomus lindquistii]
MKLNAKTALQTPTTLLVPYSPHHVPHYHTWMQSATLLALTASEPLTLEQEYAMQKSWRDDGDKLTFIICTADDDAVGRTVIKPGVKDGEKNMVGDVNLFLTESEEESSSFSSEYAEAEAETETEGQQFDYAHPTPHSTSTSPSPSQRKQKSLVAELEIMIASPSHRGKGLARSALLAFLWYVLTNLDAVLAEYTAAANTTRPNTSSTSPSTSTSNNTVGDGESGNKDTHTADVQLLYLRAKIDKDNERSIRLFKSVGFELVSEVANYWGEVEMRCPVSKMRAVVEAEGVDVKVLRYEDGEADSVS